MDKRIAVFGRNESVIVEYRGARFRSPANTRTVAGPVKVRLAGGHLEVVQRPGHVERFCRADLT